MTKLIMRPEEETTLKASLEIIEECTTRKQLLDASGRCWTQLLYVKSQKEVIDEFDKAVRARLDAIDRIRGTTAPVPKFENGNYVAPTPRLGERVIWRMANRDEKRYAADVVHIEAPGRVQLRVVRTKGDTTTVPEYVLGVHHVTDPAHESTSAGTTIQSGSWDYMQDVKIPVSHYIYAQEQIRKRERSKRQAQEKKNEMEQEFRRQEEAMRKASQDPMASPV